MPAAFGVPLAITNGEVILVVFFAALPVAAIAFALGAGKALGEIGRGQFALDQDRASEPAHGPAAAAMRKAEIRQLLEAKAFRQRQRGLEPLDVDAELERILAADAGTDLGADPALVEEVRQLVVARNQRRLRKGQEPLDVETEIARQLRDLENLGQ